MVDWTDLSAMLSTPGDSSSPALNLHCPLAGRACRLQLSPSSRVSCTLGGLADFPLSSRRHSICSCYHGAHLPPRHKTYFPWWCPLLLFPLDHSLYQPSPCIVFQPPNCMLWNATPLRCCSALPWPWTLIPGSFSANIPALFLGKFNIPVNDPFDLLAFLSNLQV